MSMAGSRRYAVQSLRKKNYNTTRHSVNPENKTLFNSLHRNYVIIILIFTTKKAFITVSPAERSASCLTMMSMATLTSLV